MTEPKPEYCFKCREVCQVYFENEPEGTAIRCAVCGAGLDYIYDDKRRYDPQPTSEDE